VTIVTAVARVALHACPIELSMPDPSPDPLLRGLQFERQGRLSEAVDAYRESARVQPEGVTALVRLGLVLRQMGHDEEANEVFGRVLAMHSGVDAE
jgi:Flp pilus assembly protein TadD